MRAHAIHPFYRDPLPSQVNPFTAAPGAVPYAAYLKAQNRVHRAGPVATSRGVEPPPAALPASRPAPEPDRVKEILAALLPALGERLPAPPRYAVQALGCGINRIDIIRQPGPTGRLLDIVV